MTKERWVITKGGKYVSSCGNLTDNIEMAYIFEMSWKETHDISCRYGAEYCVEEWSK